jgi:hypothetical protein
MRHGETGCVVTHACAGVHIMRKLMICTPQKMLFGYQMKKNEMGGACGTNGGRRGVYRVLVGKLEGITCKT